MTHRIIYGSVIAVMALLLVTMLITFTYNRSTEEALDKAQELNVAFQEAGLPELRDPVEVARVLGTDGGSVCDAVEPGVGRGLAKLNMSVGGAFFTRAVIADRTLATGLLAIVQTYCPDSIPDAEDFIDGLNLSDTIRR